MDNQPLIIIIKPYIIKPLHWPWITMNHDKSRWSFYLMSMIINPYLVNHYIDHESPWIPMVIISVHDHHHIPMIFPSWLCHGHCFIEARPASSSSSLRWRISRCPGHGPAPCIPRAARLGAWSARAKGGPAEMCWAFQFLWGKNKDVRNQNADLTMETRDLLMYLTCCCRQTPRP